MTSAINPLQNVVLLCGAALFAFVGCGSNPSNCLTDDNIAQMVAAAGITECQPLDGTYNPCGNATSHMVGQNEETATQQFCGYRGNAACGAVNDQGCNLKAEVTFTKRTYQCDDASGSTFETSCYVGTPTFRSTDSPCDPTTTTEPTKCSIAGQPQEGGPPD